MKKDENVYSDIVNHSRPVQKKHPRMPAADRAAQFAPFAALAGFEEAVGETARITEEEMDREETETEDPC